MNKISDNLKRIRKEKGWTQQELADKLYVTRQAVSNWELGKTEPDADMLIKISEIFQVNAENILGTESISPTVERINKIDKVLIVYLVLLVIFIAARYTGIYVNSLLKYSGAVTDSIRSRLDIAETVRKLNLPWYAVSLGLINFLTGAAVTRIIKYRFNSSNYSTIKSVIHISCLIIITLHCTMYFTGWCSSPVMLSVNNVLEKVTAPFSFLKLYSATMLQQYRWKFIPFGAIYEYTRQRKI